MKYILIAISLFLSLIVHAQEKAKLEVTFKNGEVLADNFELSQSRESIKALTTGEEYPTIEIDRFVNYELNNLITYYALDVRISSRRKEVAFAIKIYDKGDFEIYNASFPFKFSSPHLKMTFNPNNEAFIKRKSDAYAVSILCQDGRGCGGLMGRVKAFFADCPSLYSEMKKRNISKKDIFAITDYYIKNCSKDNE